MLAAPFVRKVVGHPDAVLDVAVLRHPGTSAYLEIIEYRGVDREPVASAHWTRGTCHPCYHVADIQATGTALTDAGTLWVSDAVVELTDGPMAGVKIIYGVDPDAVRVELLVSTISTRRRSMSDSSG